MNIQGVQEKLCFFTIHCNPSLLYITVRDLQGSQHNASVQSLLLADFLYNQWRGRGDKLLKILGKNTIFNEHLAYKIWKNLITGVELVYPFVKDIPWRAGFKRMLGILICIIVLIFKKYLGKSQLYFQKARSSLLLSGFLFSVHQVLCR